jgi:hypothetical protein
LPKRILADLLANEEAQVCTQLIHELCARGDAVGVKGELRGRLALGNELLLGLQICTVAAMCAETAWTLLSSVSPQPTASTLVACQCIAEDFVQRQLQACRTGCNT